MAMKPFIRIVKRGQQSGAGLELAAQGAQPTTPESSARAIKATVSNWVREFQQRSQTDSKRAFNNLFKEPLSGSSRA
jgi:hypothetical protein